MFAAFMERAINGSGIPELDKVPVFFLDREKQGEKINEIFICITFKPL
jgi:hypothetical protein